MLRQLSVRTSDPCHVLVEYVNHLPGLYHGYEWYGRVLEVREVGLKRYNHLRAVHKLTPLRLRTAMLV